MFSSLFNTVLYIPFYNLLVFLVDVIPGGDVGIAVIIATVIVKVILMPLSLRAVRTQRQMKLIEPELKALREKHKDDKEKQAKAMLELYKTHNVRPFASIFGILIQLPIVIALYLVFARGAIFNIDPSLLYSFVQVPQAASPLFLGVFAVAGASITLSLVAALAQAAHAHFSIPMPAQTQGKERSMGEDLGRMMAIQARFVLPIIMGVFSYFTSGAVALYFITSSVVGLLQELVVRRIKHPPIQEAAK
jgi:YidC/Oxa1 family membrane protein insertase